MQRKREYLPVSSSFSSHSRWHLIWFDLVLGPTKTFPPNSWHFLEEKCLVLTKTVTIYNHFQHFCAYYLGLSENATIQRSSRGKNAASYLNKCLPWWMWQLDYNESWALKNWYFWTVVLDKTLESPLDCKEIQPFHSKECKSWVLFGRRDAKAETPIIWPPHMKSWLIEKYWCWEGLEAGGKGEDRRWDGWMASPKLYGGEFDWTPGVGDGQGGLACCD